MQKISKLFLLLILFNAISSIREVLENGDKTPIPIEIGSSVEYDKNRKYFQFDFFGPNDTKLVIGFKNEEADLYLITQDERKKKLSQDHDNYYVNLTYNGTYYLELNCQYFSCEIGGSFYTLYLGVAMDVIDFNKNVYYWNRKLLFSDYNYNGNIEYNIKNLKEDKCVYFTTSDLNYNYYKQDYYIYSPDEYHIINDNSTIFEVFDVNENITYEDVKIFEFKANTKYIIKIHGLGSKNYDPKYSQPFIYLEYMFFVITNQNALTITGDKEVISSVGPILGIINPTVKKHFYITIDFMNYNHFYYAKTNDSIGLNKESFFKISELDFIYERRYLEYSGNETNFTVFLALPRSFENKITITILDEIEIECKDSYLVPAKKNKLIYCEDRFERGSYFEYFNRISTYTSSKKNIRISLYDVNEKTDYIIQNYYEFPIIAEKDDNDYYINITNYIPKFAMFGAENNYIFKVFFNFAQEMYNFRPGINFYNYKNVSQMNLRINSKYLPLFDFFNGYFSQFNIQLNLFIKQLYGQSDLYECSAADDERNLNFLTTPISNEKCKNKKSIFNRLFTFDGTKIVSGYIAPDSYFDIYAEIDNGSTIVDMNTLMNYEFDNGLKLNNNAKYLKKDVTYTLNFELNHMVKLEPGFDAEVTITNGQITSKLSPNLPFTEISGKGFTIKATNEVMVYFIGKIAENYVVQREINFERAKGKIIKLSNVDSEILVDIGFKGYYPSTFPLSFKTRKSGLHYIDNIYEKLKGKYVDGEKLYIYYFNGKNRNLKIDYVEKNLNNKNDNFNIFLISPNSEKNSIIVNTNQIKTITTEFHLCRDNTVLKYSFLTNDGREQEYILTNDNYTWFSGLSLFEGDNKISFTTNKPIVFSYSFFDSADNYFYGNKTYWEERQRFYILQIFEVTNKNDNDDIIRVKFKTNYKQSSTRYIIIVAQENDQNTLENFNDPCYVTGLLNKNIDGVKIEIIYDIGEDIEINAEVDISDILHKSNSYLVNIISQELRFTKNVNFYEPLRFNHVGKKNNYDNDKSDKDENSMDDTSLALAISLPIVGVIIIAVVVIFICRKRAGSSSNIEKLNG